jgi:hypothetical protein
VSALIDAGLVIELLNEHRVCYPQMVPSLVQGDDGWWRLPEGRDRLPLMYSLRARKTGPA